MADPADLLNPFGALAAPDDSVRAPWDWIPQEWAAPEVQPDPFQPAPVDPLQPVGPDNPTLSQPRPIAPEPAPAQPTMPAGPPDAISGAAPVPMSPAQPGLGIPQHLFDDAIRHGVQSNLDQGKDPWDGLTAPSTTAEAAPGNEIEFEPSTEEDRIAAMDDAEFAMYAGDREEERRQMGAAEYARALKADREQAEGELRVFTEARKTAAEKRAGIEMESARIAAESEADEPFAQSVLGAIMGALGGLVQHLNGGRNIGLEVVLNAAEQRARDLAKKQARIDQKAKAIDMESDAAREDYQDLTRFRVAALEQTARIIEADQANFDPQGTANIRREALKRQVFAKKQQAINEYEERQIKRMEAEGKTKLEVAKFMAEQENKRAQLELDKKRVGIEGFRASADMLRAKTDAAKAQNETQLLTPEYFAQAYPGNPKPPHEMTRKQYAEYVDLSTKGPAAAADARKSAAEATTKEAKARLESSGPGGSPYAIGDQEGNALVQKDGKPFEITDDTKRRRALDIMASAQNVRRIADLVKIMRADSGGASSTIGSPEYQELQSLAGQVDFETFVGYGLGAPSEGDKALAEAVRGGKDISSFVHDPSSGFEAYAKGIGEKLNTELRTQGYTGKPVKLKSIEPAQALERSEAQNLDVWNQPSLYRRGGVTGDIADRAAQRAADSADALARQSDLPSLKLLANQLRDRVTEGTFTKDQAEKVQKSIRREARRRLKGVKVGSPEHAELIKAGSLMDDAALDAWLVGGGTE